MAIFSTVASPILGDGGDRFYAQGRLVPSSIRRPRSGVRARAAGPSESLDRTWNSITSSAGQYRYVAPESTLPSCACAELVVNLGFKDVWSRIRTPRRGGFAQRSGLAAHPGSGPGLGAEAFPFFTNETLEMRPSPYHLASIQNTDARSRIPSRRRSYRCVIGGSGNRDRAVLEGSGCHARLPRHSHTRSFFTVYAL